MANLSPEDAVILRLRALSTQLTAIVNGLNIKIVPTTSRTTSGNRSYAIIDCTVEISDPTHSDPDQQYRRDEQSQPSKIVGQSLAAFLQGWLDPMSPQAKAIVDQIENCNVP